MRIDFARYKIALMPSLNNFLRRLSVSASKSVISISNFKHIFSMRFFKFKKWQKKFSDLCKSVSSEIHRIKVSSRRLFLPTMNTASKYAVDPINQKLLYASDTKIHRITLDCSSITRNSLAYKEAAIAINKSGKINEIFSMDFRRIYQGVLLTHENPLLTSLGLCTKAIIFVTLNDLTSGLRKGMRKSEHDVYIKVVRMGRRTCPAN